MSRQIFRQRTLLTFPQIIILLIILAGLAVAIDLNRRSQAGQLVGLGETNLLGELDSEQTRQVELQATLVYVESDDYVAAYARNEGGYVLPGEKRVVPLQLDAPLEPVPDPPAPPDPALDARPWQAWWQLLVDAPLPAH
mgnify:CR=1 FL=1